MSMLRVPMAIAAVAAVFAYAAPAKADIIAELTDSANDAPVFATSTAGQYQFNGAIGNFTISDLISSVSTGNTSNLLSQGLTLTANGAGTMTLTVTQTNLTSAAQVMNFASQFGAVTSNATGLTVNRTTCFDPGNGPKGGSKNEPCFNTIGSNGTLAAAANSVAEIVGNSPFSISENITFTSVAGVLPSTGDSTGPVQSADPDIPPAGSTTSLFDAVTSVPEPVSIALFFTGLVGLGLARQRRLRGGMVKTTTV